jgi:hypothetical protein
MLRGVAPIRNMNVSIPSHHKVSLWKFLIIANKLDMRHSFQHVYNEKHSSFDGEVFNQPDGTDFIGYFQTETYFKHIEPELRNTFVFCKPEINEYNPLNDSKGWSLGQHSRAKGRLLQQALDS